jgi:hypothetical protein
MMDSFLSAVPMQMQMQIQIIIQTYDMLISGISFILEYNSSVQIFLWSKGKSGQLRS